MEFAQPVDRNGIRELSVNEINSVAGGPIVIVIPKIVVGAAKVVGMAVGAAAGAAALTVGVSKTIDAVEDAAE